MYSVLMLRKTETLLQSYGDLSLTATFKVTGDEYVLSLRILSGLVSTVETEWIRRILVLQCCNLASLRLLALPARNIYTILMIITW